MISTRITASWITKKYLQAPILPESANFLRFLLKINLAQVQFRSTEVDLIRVMKIYLLEYI